MLAEIRRGAGLTQWELAAKAGISMRTVRRAERREASQFTIDRIMEVLERERGATWSKVRRVEDRQLPYVVHTGNPDDGRMANLSVERLEPGWVAWWPSRPWALCLDGYIRNVNEEKGDWIHASFAQALAAACIAAENIRRANSTSKVAARKNLGLPATGLVA